jgi:hypothetical protein
MTFPAFGLGQAFTQLMSFRQPHFEIDELYLNSKVKSAEIAVIGNRCSLQILICLSESDLFSPVFPFSPASLGKSLTER